MLSLWGPRPEPGPTRRELLRVGGLALGGLSLPHLFAGPAAASPKGGSFGKARNCIILYLSGGPAQLDTFDPKPDAPEDVRGEFGTIATALPGVRFSELLPHAATWMHKAALVRTVCHDHNDHGRGSYWMFTGYPYPGSVPDVNNMSRQDMPPVGAVVAKLAPGNGPNRQDSDDHNDDDQDPGTDPPADRRLLLLQFLVVRVRAANAGIVRRLAVHGLSRLATLAIGAVRRLSGLAVLLPPLWCGSYINKSLGGRRGARIGGGCC